MKTFTKIFTILIATLIFSNIISAKGFEMEEEEYIDDIPFNTELIVANALYAQALSVEFYLEEEEYIDDIPFNTDSLAKIALSKQAMEQEFNIEDETYIDDIPFNTNKIFQQYFINPCSTYAENY